MVQIWLSEVVFLTKMSQGTLVLQCYATKILVLKRF